MKKEIIKILENYQFDPAKQYDSDERHIDSDDFNKIANDIVQLINKNDVIGGVKELLFKKIDLVLEKYERDIENANDQKALDFLEYIKAKRNGAKGMANIVKRHFE